MPSERAIDRVWWGEGFLPALGRGALAPLEGIYRGFTAVRGALYDRGILPAHEVALPAISVGNLSVGGTGKTPVAAWIAGRLLRAGARPAIVLRGYGDDEPLVHETLNPSVPVIVSPDRVRGVARARAVGADLAVLDDAYQHRQARRDADVVLVSADRWPVRRRLLPAGPWREPLSALARASLVVVTRKAATLDEARAVSGVVAREAPGIPFAIAHLTPRELCALDGARSLALGALRGATVTAIAAVGDPRAFIRQLAAAGARVEAQTYPDHYAFTSDDVQRLAATAARSDLAVCTLKDAVKLGPHWPREAPALWYVSQQIVIEQGEAHLSDLLARVLRARPLVPDTAGRRRPQ